MVNGDIEKSLYLAGVKIYGSLIVGHKPGKVEIAFSVDDEAKARAILGITDQVGVND